MPRVTGLFRTYKRPDTKKFIITLYPSSGLPDAVLSEWNRASFANFPPALVHLRDPRSKSAADNAAYALIDYLKKEKTAPDPGYGADRDVSVGDWLRRFTSLENNPRAARLIADGSPYSPGTIDMYRQNFDHHLADDPFLEMKMVDAEVSHILSFMARIGQHKKRVKKTADGEWEEVPIAGLRVYEIVINFVRMAFNEYGEEHHDWRDPFDRIKAPRKTDERRPDVLQESEIVKLFYPGVITDVLERGVAVAMFWAGMRRGEIFGLKTTDLDWKTPKLNIDHAWKMFGNSKKRCLGDPKWHKHRDCPFPEELQGAIRVLQEEYGVHEHVFCYRDGGVPHGKWIQEKLPKWMKRAGIDPAGRRIVPHSARHSLASTLENNGVPLRYIGEMLGHKHLKTTIRYLHTPEGKINELTKRISQQFSEPKEAEPGKVIKIG
jgi:integrase/recombinase XerD